MMRGIYYSIKEDSAMDRYVNVVAALNCLNGQVDTLQRKAGPQRSQKSL